jgi:hypothetical protein
MTATVTTTTYFTNNIMVQCQITLARAIALIGHQRAIIPPDADLLEVHSPSRVVLVPDQIIINVDKAFIPQTPLPSKRGIYERDHGRCAYCGHNLTYVEASLDHIIPQHQNGPTSWDNLVNACRRCNEKKANRTPEQAHMPLLFKPYIPKVRLRPD